jgi:hypothetical protein
MDAKHFSYAAMLSRRRSAGIGGRDKFHTMPLIRLRAPPYAAMMLLTMQREEIDLLIQEAKAEREESVRAAEEKYKQQLRSLEMTWEMASKRKKTVELRPAVQPPLQAGRGRTTPQLGRPSENGPVAITRQACHALPTGYTLEDVVSSIKDRNPNADLTRKQISSALSKLVQAGEIRIISPRIGNRPGHYENASNHTPSQGETK